jgi:aspartokinase/homoserine dehydrogenase 1
MPPALPAASAPALDAPRAHKFGGSSLADAARFRIAAARIAESSVHGQPQLVVVSAMQGVTDALLALADDAARGRSAANALESLRQRHRATAEALCASDALPALHTALDADIAAITALLAAPAVNADAIAGFGEVLSSRLMHALLGAESAGWARLDAREVLTVHPGELGVAVDWDDTRARLTAWRAVHPQADVVVTGFVARHRDDGRATTLGRNGSDHSGAIFAALFQATDLTIWTDVDGVLSADPRKVPDAVCLPSLSYEEACELAYFGAKVLHPQTLAPAMAARVPILIRNPQRPEHAGTLIAARRDLPPAAADAPPVRGLTLVGEMALLELTGTGLIGVPGTAERFFRALHEAGVSVNMISQGSSEHSICCVLPVAQAERGHDAVRAAFAEALADGQVEAVHLTPDIAVLAAVGDGMVGTPGVAARLFAGLADARVNIRAIAQGASERNISVAVAAGDAERGLRAAHTAFWLSPQTLSVGVIGPGQVGRALLDQLAAAAPRLRAASRLDLRLRAVANSRRMRLDDTGLDPLAAQAALADAAPLDLEAFARHVQAAHLPHALIVDCSASDAVAAHYPAWLAAGIHVVTPNKHAGSGDLARYHAIEAATRHGGQFRYEATVGAGLPVIQTLGTLLATGDELHAIEGMLSGTLAWLFYRYDGTQPFSSLVRAARAAGYTEPDPREDLSGLDVARKLVILAREAGLPLSLADVQVENLVPEALRALDREAFLDALPALDAPIHARWQSARERGLGLRYMARLDRDGRAHVGLAELPAEHACLHARETDNVIQFHTARYAHTPLVVQGPGAGPDVTAAGVFGDLLAIAHGLGARL